MGLMAIEHTRPSAVTRLRVVLIGGMLQSCTMVGTVPRAAAVRPNEGYKLLRPGAVAVACEAGVPAWLGAERRDLLGQVTADLLGRDPEADCILHARIEWSSWSIGIYARRCVRMEGDVARAVRTVVLPMPGEHVHHDPTE